MRSSSKRNTGRKTNLKMQAESEGIFGGFLLQLPGKWPAENGKTDQPCWKCCLKPMVQKKYFRRSPASAVVSLIFSKPNKSSAKWWCGGQWISFGTPSPVPAFCLSEEGAAQQYGNASFSAHKGAPPGFRLLIYERDGKKQNW